MSECTRKDSIATERQRGNRRTSRPTAKCEPGFTLTELLVVIAIIGILIAVLLPAVQAAREAARRMQCGSHMKQIALAMHNYHDTHKRFPSGTLQGGDPRGGLSSWSWCVELLPFLEQTTMHDSLAPYAPDSILVALSDPVRLNLMQQPISIYRCPSDTSEKVNSDRKLDPGGLNTAVGRSNYLGSQGMINTCPNSEGVFCINSRITFADITDGTSNTMLGGERQHSDLKRTGKHASGIWPGATDNRGVSLPDDSPIGFIGCTRWRMQTGQQEDNPSVFGTMFCYSSRHPGGAQFILCDGSVRFISETIESRVGNLNDATTWGTYQRLSVRSDSQPVGDF